MSEKAPTTAQAVKNVAGARENVKADSRKASDKAAATRTTRTEQPEPDMDRAGDRTYHAPSTPDQASMAEQDAADNQTAPFRAIEAGYAPDNEIEATVRRMAGEGATAGEIAAYKADALAKL